MAFLELITSELYEEQSLPFTLTTFDLMGSMLPKKVPDSSL